MQGADTVKSSCIIYFEGEFCYMSDRENIAVLHVAKYLDGYDRLCDHNCIFCMERMEPGDSSETLPTLSDIKSAILQYIGKYGEITKLYIAGGEPTLRKDFIDIIKLAQGFCDNIVLSTCCDYRDVSNMVELICTLGIKCVATSIHGSTSEMHDRLTGVKGSFINTLKTIKLLSNNGVRVTVNSVMCAFNIADMPRISYLFAEKEIPIEKVTFTHYFHHGNAYYHGELKFNVDDYANVLSESLNNCGVLPYEITYRDFPLCIDRRLAEYQEVVEDINIICLNTDETIAIGEKSPSLQKEKCHYCTLIDECPKYLMANYAED